MSQTILIAGATGTLGSRIAYHLVRDEVQIRLLVRPSSLTDPNKARAIADLLSSGATLAEGDLADEESLRRAMDGVDVVVSAVQGGWDVIVDGQVSLAKAAKAAGAKRFIPSDFALDIWNAPVGAPMFDMRRAADTAIDEVGLEVLHVLNGAFMDMMLDPQTAGVVDLARGRGNFWGDGSDEFDITLIEDVARFTADLAADPSATAGIYAISGSRTSFEKVIAEVERVTGRTLERHRRGTLADLRERTDSASSPWSVVGEWYNRAMLETPAFARVDNDRYPGTTPTSLTEYLRKTIGADRP